MIEVTVHEDKVEVIGHAGYAPRGQDIVCAGITALTQTLAASFEGLTEDNPDYTIAPGVFRIETKDLSDKARFLIDSFFIGICGIAEAYPEYVRIV